MVLCMGSCFRGAQHSQQRLPVPAAQAAKGVQEAVAHQAHNMRTAGLRLPADSVQRRGVGE